MKKPSARRDGTRLDSASNVQDEDLEDFARAMADVVPLRQDPRGRVRVTPSVATPRQTSPPKPASPQADDESQVEGSFVAPGVDRREIRRLRRGDYVPSGRLDLHGSRAAEAVEAVTQFIERSRHRCVCIIHGRGLHSEGQVSIVKARVRQCLRQHRAVLAYADAPRTDGGAGAVYVLLRTL